MGGIFIFLIVRNVKHFTDFGVAFSSSHFCRIPDSLLEQVQQLHIAGSSTSYGKKQLPFSFVKNHGYRYDDKLRKIMCAA
jgi:hypothetical protein